jgi:hypothetical protein
MSVRAAVVLGFFLVVAALVHGGVWSAGNDFVVNRFTGTYEFVPGDDEEDWEGTVAMSRADACTGEWPVGSPLFVAGGDSWLGDAPSRATCVNGAKPSVA